MAIIVLKRGLKMVIENPAPMHPNYLTRYWCLKPAIIDKNRRLSGDYFVKPTQYWFIGFEPHDNLIFEPIDYVEMKRINNISNRVERSMIHPQYANRFIRRYLID
jgi:hypothetical protein